MERRFKITMHVPLGLRAGTLRFTQESTSVYGVMDILGCKSIFSGTLSEEGAAYLEGFMNSPVRSFPFTAKGTILASHLTLAIQGQRHLLSVTGEEILPQEENNELHSDGKQL